MALNLSTFKTRTLTAAVFVAVMLAGLLWNHWSFFILFSVIHFGCWREYQHLVGLIDKNYAQITPFHKYGVMLAGWCVMLYFTTNSFSIFGLHLHEIGFSLGLIFTFVLPMIEILFARQIELKNIAYSALGLLYISLSWGLLMHIRTGEIWAYPESVDPMRPPSLWVASFAPVMGYTVCLFLIGSIWVNDTMAYIVGSLIGKTPFSKISPKKTWEGTAGGAILAVAVVGFIAWLIKFNVVHAVFIATIAAVVGTLGDLLESKLKRMAGVKDSGHIMPGHGGFLDRFDSLLLAIPFVWLYVMLFMK